MCCRSSLIGRFHWTYQGILAEFVDIFGKMSHDLGFAVVSFTASCLLEDAYQGFLSLHTGFINQRFGDDAGCCMVIPERAYHFS